MRVVRTLLDAESYPTMIENALRGQQSYDILQRLAFGLDIPHARLCSSTPLGLYSRYN
jgi:hypothetical protein